MADATHLLFGPTACRNAHLNIRGLPFFPSVYPASPMLLSPLPAKLQGQDPLWGSLKERNCKI